MRVKGITTPIVLMLPMLLGGATKTDWEDWNRHGFNHPYHENNLIVRLEAGETINDIFNCGFFTTIPQSQHHQLVASHLRLDDPCNVCRC